MRIKNSEMISAINALNDIRDKEMPVALAYKMVNAVNKLLEKNSVYEETLSVLNTDKEREELLNLIVEVDIAPFLMSEFTEANLKLTPLQMFGLQVLIDG